MRGTQVLFRQPGRTQPTPGRPPHGAAPTERHGCDAQAAETAQLRRDATSRTRPGGLKMGIPHQNPGNRVRRQPQPRRPLSRRTARLRGIPGTRFPRSRPMRIERRGLDLPDHRPRRSGRVHLNTSSNSRACPCERFGAHLALSEVPLDGADERRRGWQCSKSGTTNLLDPPENLSDTEQPKGRGRNKVQVEVTMMAEPGLHVRLPSNRVVRRDQMHARAITHPFVDACKEPQESSAASCFPGLADDLSCD